MSSSSIAWNDRLSTSGRVIVRANAADWVRSGAGGGGDGAATSWRRLYVALCIIGMLVKSRPVQLALAVITLAVQVIYILIEMNALGSW